VNVTNVTNRSSYILNISGNIANAFVMFVAYAAEEEDEEDPGGGDTDTNTTERNLTQEYEQLLNESYYASESSIEEDIDMGLRSMTVLFLPFSE